MVCRLWVVSQSLNLLLRLMSSGVETGSIGDVFVQAGGESEEKGTCSLQPSEYPE